MSKLKDIFEVKQGIHIGDAIEISKEKKEGYILYVRPSNNHADTVAGYVNEEEFLRVFGKEINGIIQSDKIYPAQSLYISVNGEGSHTYTYISTERFIANTDVNVLIPYEEMSLFEKQYYASCIVFNRYRFSYGRKPRGSKLQNLHIPSKEELPSWLKDINNLPDVSSIPDYFLDEGYAKACWYLDNVDVQVFENEYSSSITKENQLNLIESNFEKYKISDIFDIDTGKDLIYSNLVGEDHIVIGHSVSNNGIVSRTSPLDSYTLYDHRRTLSLAHIGNFCSYVQDEDFYIGTRAKALKLKNYILEKYYGNTLDKCVLMYISSIINMESFRFSYGRVGGDKVGNLEIKLPGKKLPNGNFELVINPETNKEIVIPDFEFMERYIKSLKYSSAIKE